MVTGLLLTLAGYLCGSIPWGLLLARWGRGIDIREHGSRNIGATNVWRTLGWKWGLSVFLLDFAKGALPTWGLPWLGVQGGFPDSPAWAVACGAATIVGHMFPIWLGFKGGKGVATAVGVVVVLAPMAAGLAALTWGVVFGVSRMVSLASILAAILFAVVQLAWVIPPSQWSAAWPIVLFSVAVPALILIRHRANIVRILRGEEHRFGKPKDVPSHNG
jgi:glycerol-3-phosphate acyltransferase PlsY